MRKLFVSAYFALTLMLSLISLTGCSSIFGNVITIEFEPATNVTPNVEPTTTPDPTPQNLFSVISPSEGTINVAELVMAVKISQEEVDQILGDSLESTQEGFFNDVPIALLFLNTPCGNQTTYHTQGFNWHPGMSWKTSSGGVNPNYHPGLDMVCNRNIAPNQAFIYPTAPGVVIRASYISTRSWESVSHWVSGNTVVVLTAIPVELLPNELIQHSYVQDGYALIVHLYGHMSSLYVDVGDLLDVNTPLGIQGSTGRSTGTHVHYGMYLYNPTNREMFAVHPYALTGEN